MAVDLASPLFPKGFLIMTCFGSIARALTGNLKHSPLLCYDAPEIEEMPCLLFFSGVAGGATRAALTQHFALSGNAADVAAKEQSQETAVTATGMISFFSIFQCQNT